MCSPNILSPMFMFAFIFHCRSFSPCWPLAFLIVSQPLWIFMFFFLQNSSLLFSITRSSSFSVIHVSVMPVVQTNGRAGRRSVYGHVITKFSRMGSLPHFFTHGAPLRALRARELRYDESHSNRQYSYNSIFNLFCKFWLHQQKK